MRSEEILNIKKYVEGAYPNLKKDPDADIIWLDMLKDYNYLGVLEAVRNYIKSGNKYPPTLAEIIKGYEVVLDKHQEEVLTRMVNSGMFDDPNGADPEIAAWNKENRIDKARYWMSLEKPSWPGWFLTEYKKHLRNIIQIKYGGRNEQKYVQLESEGKNPSA